METKPCNTCKQSLPLDSFESFKRYGKQTLRPICKACRSTKNKEYRAKTQYDKNYYLKNRESKLKVERSKPRKTCRRKGVVTVTERNFYRRATKQKCIDYKGGQCEICGYAKCPAALEFHHTDPTQKEFSIANFKKAYNADLENELDKCILVCSNCHRELHHGSSL